MDKYQEIVQHRSDEKISENEIRVQMQTPVRSYISYATNKFNEKKGVEVVLRAMGRAINKTVTIAEILKRRVPGLHQITKIDSTDIKSIWEPLEEGLDRVETTRHVSAIAITLSQNPLDTKNPGYQAPIPEDQVKPAPIGGHPSQGHIEGSDSRGRGRGRGRGGRGGRGGRRGGPRNGPGSDQQGQQQITAPQQSSDFVPRGRGGFRGGAPRGRGGFRGAPRGGAQSSSFQHDNNQIQNNNNNSGPTDSGFRGGRGGFRGAPRGNFRGAPRGSFNRGRGGRGRGDHQGGAPSQQQ